MVRSDAPASDPWRRQGRSTAIQGRLAHAQASLPVRRWYCKSPCAVAQRGRYCWRTYFKVLAVLFLASDSPAYMPSKKACRIYRFRHFWVRPQYRTPFVTHAPGAGAGRSIRSSEESGAGRHVHVQVLAEDACGDPHRSERVRYAASYRFRGDTSIPKQAGRDHDRSFFWVGTGMPGIFTLTAPRWLRLVK